MMSPWQEQIVSTGMKTMCPDNEPRHEGGQTDDHDPIALLLDRKSGLYIESYFVQRLCSERQRATRSQRPLLMMLLALRSWSREEKKKAIRNVVAVLGASVRETDLKGWYRKDAVIGVLFTEACAMDRETLKRKIYGNLCERLTPDQANGIDISFHGFPEELPADRVDQERSDEQQSPDDKRTFYPDLMKPKLSKNVYFVMKRAIDIWGSLLAVIMFSPVFVASAIAIKLSSRGPIIFRQERVGLYGRKFVFWKFRSMYINNDSTVHRKYVLGLIEGQTGSLSGGGTPNGNGVYKITNDVRITRVGRFMRKTSLDELPQFFNVLKGDMSLVGPRPPIPYEIEKYQGWHKRRVLEVKPGISGLWQIRGRSRTTFDEMVRLDLRYIKEQSIWLDVKILLQTPWAVLTGRGAY